MTYPTPNPNSPRTKRMIRMRKAADKKIAADKKKCSGHHWHKVHRQMDKVHKDIMPRTRSLGYDGTESCCKCYRERLLK